MARRPARVCRKRRAAVGVARRHLCPRRRTRGGGQPVRTRLQKSLIIARWEFLATVTRRAYLFAVLALPLVYGGMTAAGVFVGRVTADRSSRLPILVVDRAHALDLETVNAVETEA